MAETKHYLDLSGLTKYDELLKGYITAGYMPLDKTVAGLNVKDNPTKAQMLTALNVEDGAQVNAVEGVVAGTVLSLDANKKIGIDLSAYYTADECDGKFVAIEAGKRLMTDAEGTKLAGIAEGAEVNVIDEIVVKDEEIVSLTGKKVTIDLDAYAKKADITAVLRFRGTVATVDDLPKTGVAVGDVYIVTADNSEHVCTAVTPAIVWEKLGPVVDLSNYYTKGEVDTIKTTLEGKITAEETRAKGAEGDLDDKIDGVDAAYKAADTQIRTDFAAADTQIRTDFAAADASTLAEAKEYADGLDDAMDARMLVVEAAKHTHDNKTVLDGITSTKVSNWDSAKTIADRLDGDATVTGSVKKQVADAIATEVTNRNDAITAAIEGLDASKSQAAGADGLALAIVEENGKITSISGSIAAQTYDTYGDAAQALVDAKAYTDGKVADLDPHARIADADIQALFN